MISRAWAIRTGGWEGTVTLDDGAPTVIAPPAFGSALSQAIYIRDHGPSYLSVALRDSGVWRFSGSPAFAMSESGNVLQRLGFIDAPYASATSHTAAARGVGTSAPYAMDVVGYDDRPATSSSRGYRMHGHTVRRSRGAGEWRAPVIVAQVTMAHWLEAIEHWDAYIEAPAEIDVLLDVSGELTLRTLHASDLRVRVLDSRTGWAQLELRTHEVTS